MNNHIIVVNRTKSPSPVIWLDNPYEKSVRHYASKHVWQPGDRVCFCRLVSDMSKEAAVYEVIEGVLVAKDTDLENEQQRDSEELWGPLWSLLILTQRDRLYTGHTSEEVRECYLVPPGSAPILEVSYDPEEGQPSIENTTDLEAARPWIDERYIDGYPRQEHLDLLARSSPWLRDWLASTPEPDLDRARQWLICTSLTSA